MNRLIFLTFLFPVLLFSQYGNNVMTNGDFSAWTGDDPDGWTIVEDASNIVTESPAGKANIVGDGSGLVRMKQGVLVDDVTYRVIFNVSGATGILNLFFTGAADPITATGIDTIEGPSDLGLGDFYFRNAAPGANDHTIDDVVVRERLDTLWIDAAQSDETDTDSTKTLTEAFETRGAHSGGVFLTVTGTYAESITIDSSFSSWSSTGGVVTVTQVDFNNVTCTVDCNIYNNIGTVLNASNVTVNNSACVDDKGYKKYSKYKRYKGW